MAGKLKSRSGVNAICPGPMVFLHGHTTGICFLADSRTAVSMIPGLTSTNTTLFISLTAANGAAITISEEMQLTLHFKDDRGSLHQLPFSFLQVDVDGLILGSEPGHLLPTQPQRQDLPRRPIFLPQQPCFFSHPQQHPTHHIFLHRCLFLRHSNATTGGPSSAFSAD